jgi:hypothetical protein
VQHSKNNREMISSLFESHLSLVFDSSSNTLFVIALVLAGTLYFLPAQLQYVADAQSRKARK